MVHRECDDAIWVQCKISEGLKFKKPKEAKTYSIFHICVAKACLFVFSTLIHLMFPQSFVTFGGGPTPWLGNTGLNYLVVYTVKTSSTSTSYILLINQCINVTNLIIKYKIIYQALQSFFCRSSFTFNFY